MQEISLKTDRKIISDLPDKTEVTAFCGLSKRQAALYAQAVGELATQLQTTSGIERKGLVLASLMRLKQICNHPSQLAGDLFGESGGEVLLTEMNDDQLLRFVSLDINKAVEG